MRIGGAMGVGIMIVIISGVMLLGISGIRVSVMAFLLFGLVMIIAFTECARLNAGGSDDYPTFKARRCGKSIHPGLETDAAHDH